MKTEVKQQRNGYWSYWVKVGSASNYGTRANEGAARSAAQDDGHILTLVNSLRSRDDDE